MKKQLLTVLALSVGTFALAQVGINTENPQGMFHVDAGKDNPSTGTPTTTQQANDLTVLNTGYVGIGTTTPKQQLHIVKGDAASNLTDNSTLLTGISITGSGSNGNQNGPGMYLENTAAPTGEKVMRMSYGQLSTFSRLFTIYSANDDGTDKGGNPAFSVAPHLGRVGVNVNTPQTNLSVQGNAFIGGNSPAPPNGLLVVGNTGLGVLSTTLTNRLSINGATVIGPAGSTYFSTAGPAGGLAVQGSVGIGTITPQKKLHIVGGLQLTNELNIGGTATTAGSSGTVGQVLTSNGAGNAPTWETPSGTGTEVDGVIGNEVINGTAGGALIRAGAGTAADPYTLDVADQGITTTKIADNSVTYAKINTPVKAITTDYTLLPEDSGGFIYSSGGTALTITAPTTLPIGFHCVIIQQGTAQVTVVGASGFTLNSARGNKTRARYSAVGVVKHAGNVGVITGDAIN